MTERDRLPDEMTRVWHAAPIDLTAWTFFEDEDQWRDLLATGFSVHVTKVLRDVLQDSPPSLWFACKWIDSDGVGGKPPDDAATLYLGLPLGAEGGEGDEVCWSISLEGVVDGFFESCSTGGKLEGDYRTAAINIAARLRELADKLEGATV